MVEYIIHIGPPKSGSKYIQSQLFHARKYLEEHGILYPDIWWERPDKIMHDSVRDHLKAGKDLKGDFQKLNASGAEKIILSCEGFDGLELTELRRLKEYTAGNPVQIVYYARRWSDRIPSDWRQQVMMGYYVTFPEYYIRQLSYPEGTGEVNYSIVWERFAKIFGRDSLRIVSFNNLLDRDVDLFRHFCEDIVGVHDVPQVAKGLIQRNAGPDMFNGELMRALNYLYCLETSRTDQTMRIKFDRLKQKYDLQTLRAHMKTDMRQIKLKDNAAPLRTTWEAISTYKDRLVSPQYGQQIFERCDVEVEFVGQNYLLREGILDELTKLYHFLKTGEVYSPELQALQQARAGV
jgi:hypothetical protein